MNRIINPFTSFYETIDIHGETTETVVFVIETFIKYIIKIKNKNLLIINWKGCGKLKKKKNLKF